MDQEMSFTYTRPLNVNVVEIKGVEHLFVEGDISTNDLDLVNDIMTKECQESMQKQIMDGNLKLDLEHEAFRGDSHEEKEINKTKIPAGKLVDATVKDLGEDRYSTRVKGEINIHNPDYKAIKGNLMDKYLDAFSVAFLPVETKNVEIDGEQVQLLNDVKLLNVALTGNPCNTKAQLVDVSTKSMSALDEYKKMKKLDPSIEKKLVVKSAQAKENPLSFIWNKMMYGDALDKKELKLLKAAIDVAGNNGTQAQLIKEYYDRVEGGEKLSWKEYYVFRELIEVEYKSEEQMLVAETSKSHLISHKGDSQLNNHKNSIKMTEDPKTPEGTEGKPEGQENVNGDVEQKAMLKDIAESMKSMHEKYDAVIKENESMKDSVSKNTEALAKITKALEQPIHKSPGAALTEAEIAAKAGTQSKSVDPLELCF